MPFVEAELVAMCLMFFRVNSLAVSYVHAERRLRSLI
jgi:hypothetical protein